MLYAFVVAAMGATELSGSMPSAPAGVVEAGTPPFVVLGPEAIGLSSTPTDIHLLPDGSILVVSQQELAFGDGVRWKTFRTAPNSNNVISSQVAVDRDGRIYTGIAGQIGRVEIGEDAQWRITPVSPVPDDGTARGAVLVNVQSFKDTWYWYGGSGAIVAWRPDQEARISGHVAAIERIFQLDKEVYASSQASGHLYRLGGDGSSIRVTPDGTLASDCVTCSAPFGPGQLLVGTNGGGLRLFDGSGFRDFAARGFLGTGHRINDVCPAGDGFFAAAVDNVGIVFFDRSGQIVQVADRTFDHRLARVQRVVYAPNGVLWALLNDSVARIAFPSPLSDFEALVSSGLAYARPLRYEGRLWLLADGRAMRGVYDETGRLERFDEDMPPGRYAYALTEAAGNLFIGNDAGIFVREGSAWRSIAAGIRNARVGVAASAEGVLYIAQNEYGWIRKTADGFQVKRVPAPGLGDSYNAITDGAGVVWLEQGASRVARIDLRHGDAVVESLGMRHGLMDGWVQIFVIDGIAYFNTPNHLAVFDERAHRFVEDHALSSRYPEVIGWNGRPSFDAGGRLWFTANGTAHVLMKGRRRPARGDAADRL